MYYLGLDAHLVVRGTAIRWGMGMYSTGEGRAGWGWGRGPEREGLGLEEFTAWVENRTLSAKH